MKKSVRSIVAFVVLLTMVLSILSPISAITVENTNKTTVLLNAEKQSALSSDIPISERYHAIENGYRGKYDLQEGIFGHQSSQQKNKNAVYFYSDGYFEDTPDIYNPSLSTMSLALSLSAFNAQYTDFDLTLPNGEYSNLFRHSKMLMSDIGINDKDIYVNDSFDIAPTDNTIGMIMGAKKILIEDKDYILIPIAVRGGDYKAEWASNATLGKNGEAYGFSSSATKVMEQIEAYITSNSSFDIPSAIDEGKVKFWIVGYSRGGAVANIAAKRLTDIYGKQGNSIYSYTFEAPSGGVDAEEMNESWTYNGIYANIHNIINPSDLIPNIPPKQMGFKRYGVDHYSPGTDVGAIKTTTYVTPTGITVTSHSDNEAYEVGEENYNQRRENMLHYLSDIDSSIVFSDEFSIVNIDIMQVLSGGELFESVESGQNATSAEWIKCFIEDLQKWAANGTMSRGKYDNGDYENDYRAFYTSNNEFAGKNHVTVEVALQNILKLIFTYQYDEEFATALMHRGISLISDYMNILDFYLNVIKKWDKLSKSNQVKYLDKIWNGLDGDLKLPDGTTVKKISDFVELKDYGALKNSVYTLCAFMFLFICKDNNTSPSINGINAKQVHLATLLFNGKTIIQGHYPEICLAWLSTYDNNYSAENTSSQYLGAEINLKNDINNIPPELNFEIEIKDGKSIVSLSSIIKSSAGVDKNSVNNGSAIYYAVFENGNMVGSWQLYRSPFVISATNDTQYSVKAFAVRFEEKGKELEISNDELLIPTEKPTPPSVDNQQNNNQNDTVNETPNTNTDTAPEEKSIFIAIISSATLLVIGFTALLLKKKRK